MQKSFLDKNNNFIDVPKILDCSIVDLKYHLDDLKQKCNSKIKKENPNFDDPLRLCLNILLFPANIDDYIKCYFDQLTQNFPFLLTIRNQEEIIDSIEPKYKSEFYTMLLEYKFPKSLQQFNDSVKQMKASMPPLYESVHGLSNNRNNVASFTNHKRAKLLESYEQLDVLQLKVILDGKQEILKRFMQERKNPQIVEIIHNIEALDKAIKNPKTDMDKQRRDLYIARKEMLSRTVEALLLKYPSIRDNNIMSIYEEITIIQNILETKNKKGSRAQ